MYDKVKMHDNLKLMIRNMNPYVLVSVATVLLFIMYLSYSLYATQQAHKEYRRLQINAMVRQTARWAGASQQDKSPMISLLHANYAAGYLQALELIATENDINQVMNLQKLRVKVYGAQDRAARRVMSTCPDFVGEDIDKELILMGVNVKQ